MKFADLGGVIRSGVKSNSNIILSVLAGAGTVTTAYLAAKASFKAADVIRDHESANGVPDDSKQRLKDRTRLVWKLYIPSAVSATTTVGFIVGLNRVGVRRVLAIKALQDSTELAYSAYRDKVREEFGARKDQSIRDKVAEDRVRSNPPPSQDILVTGPGNVLCCELFTGRYFASDMETLRRAQNTLNDKLLKHDYATLDDFYYLIKIGSTSTSGNIGWKSDKLMEMEFSTILTEDNRPCLAFTYNYVKDI